MEPEPVKLLFLELNGLTLELVEQGRDSLDAYRVNPLAFRIVELCKNYVLGRGVQVGSHDELADNWIHSWWTHPQNRMDLRLRQGI